MITRRSLWTTVLWGALAAMAKGDPAPLLLAAATTPASAQAAAARIEAAQLTGAATNPSHPLDPAIELMAQCKRQMSGVHDYTATFVKHERIGRKMEPETYIEAKFRSQPFSVYLRWLEPEEGKEAIYVEGQNDGKIVTHGTGLTRALAGSVHVDPEGSFAKSGNRHTIREAGIGHLLESLLTAWSAERTLRQTRVNTTHVKINGRPCYLLTAGHPDSCGGRFQFHTVKVYVDKQWMLPVRMEGYGYPPVAGADPGPLLECYTYVNLKVNVGLTDVDFSPRNPTYGFSRF